MFERYPLILPLIGLVTGILLGGFSSVSILQAALICGVFFTLFLILSAFFKLQRGYTFLVAFLLAGYCLTIWQDERYRSNHIAHQLTAKERRYAGVLNTYPLPTKKAIRLEVNLIAKNEATPLNGTIYLYVPKDTTYQTSLPGDKILFSARLNPIDPPKNPHEFDYRNYLHLHQIYAQGYTSNAKIISTDHWSVRRWASGFRAELLQLIDEMDLEADEKAIASALLLGYRHFITDETTQAFAGAGAMHVLAVSGLHVGILYMVIAFLLGVDRRKPHKNNWRKVLVIVIIIWSYAILTGLSPSVSRAAVMFTFLAVGGLIKRKTSSMQVIIASALVLLAIKPNYLFEVGFQLSYAAVFGIIYLQPKIYRLIPHIPNRIVDYAWQITAVSIAAQAATFPLSVYYFHQFPVLFVFSNLFVIPLAFLTMGYGLFVLVVSIFTGVLPWLIWPLKGLLWLMINGVGLIEGIPHAVVTKLWIGRVEIILYLILVFTLVEVFWKYRKWALFTATSVSIALLVNSGYRSFERAEQHQLTFYSIKKQPAIELRQGRKSVLLANNDLLEDTDAMLFHIRHNLWAGGIDDLIEIPIDSNFQSAFIIKRGKIIDINGARLLLMNDQSDTNYFMLKPDYILLSRNIKPPKNIPEISTIVFQHGISEGTKTQWHDLQNASHDLEVDNALVVNLEKDY